MSGVLLLSVYCLAIAAVSLAGGWLPMWIRLTHTRMQLAVSLVAGYMLGVGLLHLLPHALEQGLAANTVVLWTLAGFLAMFFIERFFCFHHHDVPVQGRAHDHDHVHDHHHSHELTWSAAAVGLTLHSIIAGVSLAASMTADEDVRIWAGLPVFLSIVLHKPLDSMTLGTLMAAGGWSMKMRHLVNVAFAMAIPIGAGLFYVISSDTYYSKLIVGPTLAFAVGAFLCVSMSDLLPELQFHHHDRLKLSASLLLGLALAWLSSQMQTHEHHEPTEQGSVTVGSAVRTCPPASPIRRSPQFSLVGPTRYWAIARDIVVKMPGNVPGLPVYTQCPPYEDSS